MHYYPNYYSRPLEPTARRAQQPRRAPCRRFARALLCSRRCRRRGLMHSVSEGALGSGSTCTPGLLHFSYTFASKHCRDRPFRKDACGPRPRCRMQETRLLTPAGRLRACRVGAAFSQQQKQQSLSSSPPSRKASGQVSTRASLSPPPAPAPHHKCAALSRVDSACRRLAQRALRSVERAEGVGVGGEGRWSTVGCEDATMCRLCSRRKRRMRRAFNRGS